MKEETVVSFPSPLAKITVRDTFAIEAMRVCPIDAQKRHEFARYCYGLADAMMLARKQ